MPAKVRKPKKDWKDYVDVVCEQLTAKKGAINACKTAGIHFSTHYEWIERFSEYAERIKKAELAGEKFGKEYAIQAVFAAMSKSWQAGAWWLERKYPDEFGKRLEATIGQPEKLEQLFKVMGEAMGTTHGSNTGAK